MRILNRLSLRRKLVLWIVFTAGLALLLAMGVFLTIEVAGNRALARRELSTLAAVLGEGSTASLDFQYPAEAERLLATLHVHRNIQAAALYDRKGKLFAAYRREDCGNLPLPEQPSPELSVFEAGNLWVTRPVVHSGEVLGLIYVRSDLSDFHGRVRWGLASAFLIIGLVGTAVLVFAMRVGRVISQPIRNLAETARRVATHRDTGERVARETQDEVGVLVDAFNEMLDQLGERQARLEEAQRMAHLGNWSLEPGSGRIECSEELLKILGIEGSASVQEFQILHGYVHPEDQSEVQRLLALVQSEGGPQSIDCRILRQDGSLRWVHCSARLFQDASGQRQVRGTLMDITERRNTEAAIRHAQKLESMGVLAGGIAHDFNNLLGAMLGNLGLARMDLPEGSPADEYLVKAEAIAQSAAVLTRQMLAYSGKGRFEVKLLDLGVIVKEMGSLISVSISKKVELHYVLDPATPMIMADPAQIQQVVMNLVVNASDAMDGREGHIRIRTELERLQAIDLTSVYAGQEMAPGNYVVLEVQDDGHGMDAATLERIFDPFFTTKFAGRGLGLAALLGIVKGHRGGIKVYSEPGKGTTFKILFPASSEALVKEVPQQEPGDFQSSGLVIVADDEPQIRTMAKIILERMGFEVLQAGHGLECLELFRLHPGRIRLILLDLTMPQMDGAECFRALRELDPALPVILSSGFSEQNILASFESEGPAGFLQKPYLVGALMAKVKEILEP